MSAALAARRRVPSEWRAVLDVALQPIVGVDGTVLGREGLLRSQPARAPEDLFRLALVEGWADDLDAFAAELAVVAASTWCLEGELLFVNAAPMPPIDLPVWLSRLGRAAVREGFPLDRVVVELNEHQTGGTRPVLPRLLNAARELGLRFALDDIDAGPRAVRVMTSLAAEFVKLDGSVVTQVHLPEVAAQVHQLVDVAGQQGTVVIAEKIETERQVDALLGLGVQQFQGWLMGAPVVGRPESGQRWRRVS